MEKKVNKKIIMVAVVMSFVAIIGVGFLKVDTRAARYSVHMTTESKITMKKGTVKYVGPGRAGKKPETKNWKSSNPKVATVSSKGDAEGGHKVTAKKKGKTTISCTISKTKGEWAKGDTCKWIVTVK